MDQTKIALIGSAEIPPGIEVLPAPLAEHAVRIDALAPDCGVATPPGLRLLQGSFLDAGKIETAVRGATTVVYAPRSRRALIPVYFERGLRYTLLAAGWAGVRTLIVVPPAAPFDLWPRMQEWWCRRITARALRVLSALPRGRLLWRLTGMGEVIRLVAGSAPEFRVAAAGSRPHAGRRLCAVPPPGSASAHPAAKNGEAQACRPRSAA